MNHRKNLKRKASYDQFDDANKKEDHDRIVAEDSHDDDDDEEFEESDDADEDEGDETDSSFDDAKSSDNNESCFEDIDVVKNVSKAIEIDCFAPDQCFNSL